MTTANSIAGGSAFGKYDLFVSPCGNDGWSGRPAEPNEDGTDGPLKTVAAARDRVRERKEAALLSGAVTVWLREGVYPQSAPLRFGPADSYPATYASYPGERAVIDGGKRITGWEAAEWGGAPCWIATLPEVAAGKAYYRQLFVNGGRRERPRLPKRGLYRMADVPGTGFDAELFAGSDTFRYEPGDIGDWRNLADVDVVALHYWVDERMPIAERSEADRTIRSSRRSIFALKDDVASRYANYYVENVFEALTEPGEWYLDRPTGKLYYLPLEGETPEDAEAYVCVTEQLLVLEGDPAEGQYVDHVRFRDLTFRHAEWSQPAGGGERFGMPGIDFAAAPQAAIQAPGVIELKGARYCAVEDCAIEHIGFYGIAVTEGSLAIRILGNEIRDAGAGGVKLDGGDAGAPAALRTGNHRITDNHIHHVGNVFRNAVGILAMHAFGNRIAHNHIHDLYYTGISCGWVWGYGDNVSRDNALEHNHIHDLGKGLLSDMGGIYTLGVQPGTTIRGNLIHDAEKKNYGGWGIYLDEGSSHITVENNICLRTSSQSFHQHYGRENIVRNNIFAYAREGQIALTRAEEHRSFTFQHNIVLSDGQPMFVGGERRGRLEKGAFASELNFFWDRSGRPPVCVNGGSDEHAGFRIDRNFAWEEWTALGQDVFSVAADPGPDAEDPALLARSADSPCRAVGFRPFDIREAGPRDPAGRD